MLRLRPVSPRPPLSPASVIMLHLRPLCGLLLGFVCAGPALASEPPPVRTPIQTSARNAKDAALIIGNEAYVGLPQVTWAANDAAAFAGWARDTLGVAAFRMRTLENADADDILREARRVSYRVRRGGTLWVYFAGHGAVNAQGEKVLLGANAQAGALDAGGLALGDLVARLERTQRARRVVLVLDAGFGNTGRDGLVLVPGREVDVTEGFSDVETERTVVWAAATDARRAERFVAAKHGLFTWTVLGALRGWADGALDGTPDGTVTLGEAQVYAQDAARALGRPVHPTRTGRTDAQGWVLDQGAHLEAGPEAAVLQALGREDLVRRIDRAEAALRADAAAFWADTLALAHQGGDAGKDALQAYIDEFSSVQATVSWAVSIPEVAAARQALANFDSLQLQPPGGDTSAPVESCDDLLTLESAAMLGQLSPGQRDCLDRRIATERLQTDKSKISKVLLVNAESAGDRGEWQRLMQRHLEDIDRSEPDLCFAYALYLHRGGSLEHAEDVVRWAGYALENKQVWDGTDHVTKVLGLMRLRAEAANRLWLDAEKAFQRSASEEAEGVSETYRGWTKDFSREWLDFSRAANDASARARQMCEAASGSSAFCAPGAPR